MSGNDEAVPVTPDVPVPSGAAWPKRPVRTRQSPGPAPVNGHNGQGFAARLADSAGSHRSACPVAPRGTQVPVLTGALTPVWNFADGVRGTTSYEKG